MFEDKCKKCDGRLVLDNLATAGEYNKETTVIIDTNGEPTVENLPNYVVLVCTKCNTKTKRTFDELIIDLKYSFLKSLITVRQLDSYENIDKGSLREESGLSYCGMCPGPFDADGYCLNDLKNQCIVRKACLNKKDE